MHCRCHGKHCHSNLKCRSCHHDVHSCHPYHSCHRKHRSCLHSSTLQDAFSARFGISPELVPGIAIKTFQDIDGCLFDGVVIRDTSSSQIDVVSFARDRLIEEMQTTARHADGNAQPPSLDELAVYVTLARAQATGGIVSQASSAAPAAALSVMPNTDHQGNDTTGVYSREVLDVASTSLAAGTAGQASQLGPARNPSRQQIQGTASRSSSAHGSHGGGAERLDGSSSTTFAGNIGLEDVQAMIDKMSIWTMLKDNSNMVSGMTIYNIARRSAMHSPVPCQHNSIIACVNTSYMLLCTIHIADA